MCTSKEIAKFFAGFMFSGLFGHVWFAYHSELMPLKVWGITMTSGVNNFGIAFHIVATLLLAWYGWFRSCSRTKVCH